MSSSWNDTIPRCPDCGTTMRERTSQYGRFWGCSMYPKCRGIVDWKVWKERVREGAASGINPSEVVVSENSVSTEIKKKVKSMRNVEMAKELEKALATIAILRQKLRLREMECDEATRQVIALERARDSGPIRKKVIEKVGPSKRGVGDGLPLKKRLIKKVREFKAAKKRRD
jgi:ssDNA-binding Zn-finger/Zn-ribbon topoisomerase 1